MAKGLFRHWTSSVPLSVRVDRMSDYPKKLKRVVGDPRGRLGTFYEQLHLLQSRYGYAADLTGSEFRVFSQNGEDGVIAEIVRRLGPECKRTFVEFGMGRGWAGNCVFLADVLGWHGLFIEPALDDFTHLQRKYRYTSRVRTICEFVSPDNIDAFITRAELDGLGVLSIDVDGNDYYIWRNMTSRAALVVIEYNGSLPYDEFLVQPFSDKPWDGTAFFGCSLAALTKLGEEKGYQLVHTEMTGTNAFFVADEHASCFTDILDVPTRVANYELLGHAHPRDRTSRTYLGELPPH